MPHTLSLYVRFADTDALGHVNNGVYAQYAEAGRITFLKACEVPIEQMILAHLSMDFRRPLLFGEDAAITTSVEKYGRSSITLVQRVVVGDDTVADLRSVVVLYDYASKSSQPLDAATRIKLDAEIA